MSFQFRVVQKRKRRGVRQTPIQKTAADSHAATGWLDHSLMEEKDLRNLPRAIWEGLNAISSVAIFRKGSVLFVEGEKSLGVFVVRKGMVKLSTDSADGKSLIVGRAGIGEVLGLPSALSGRANELTAEAMSLVQCSFIARDAFLQFLERNGGSALHVAETLSHMYDDIFGQVRFLGLSSTATEKLARLLLELPGHEPSGNGYAKTLPLTHKEIAEMIGASRETVTRLFTRFKREQLVRVHGEHLHILDQTGLEQLLTL